jgi:hypothetical protein
MGISGASSHATGLAMGEEGSVTCWYTCQIELSSTTCVCRYHLSSMTTCRAGSCDRAVSEVKIACIHFGRIPHSAIPASAPRRPREFHDSRRPFSRVRVRVREACSNLSPRQLVLQALPHGNCTLLRPRVGGGEHSHGSKRGSNKHQPTEVHLESVLPHT